MTADSENTPSSSDLLELAARGDRKAFCQLVERHRQYAYGLAFRIVCNADDARDVVQEAFIRVWRHAGRYRKGTKFTTWLYTIVTNLALDLVRMEARKRRLFTVRSQMNEDLAATSRPDGADAVADRDLADRIRQLSGDLPPRQRVVFVLRDLQDLPVCEVAQILKISENAVKVNLCHARRHLRQRIEKGERG